MKRYFKQVAVEEEKEGDILWRWAQIAVYPILEWLDDLGTYHELTLFGSDVDWLLEMHVSIEDRGSTEDRPDPRFLGNGNQSIN